MLRFLLLLSTLLFSQPGHSQEPEVHHPSIHFINEGLGFDLVHRGETLSRQQLKHFLIHRELDFIEVRGLQRSQATGKALMVSGTYFLGGALEGDVMNLVQLGTGAAMFLTGTICSLHCKLGMRKLFDTNPRMNQPRSQTWDFDVQLTLLPNLARIAFVF